MPLKKSSFVLLTHTVSDRSLDEKETIIVASWAYMLKTIRPKRCARPAFKTLENYTSCARKLHYDSGSRFDIICLDQMLSFKYVRRQIRSFLVAHGPTEEAKPLVPLHMFRTLLRQWDLTNPLQALLGAIVLLETFSGRRTGDVLPKLWSTYVAFGNLTLFARHFLLHRPRLDGVGRLSRVRTNWSRTASSRKSVVLDCRTDCAVHGDLSPWLRYVMADGRGFDQPAPPRRLSGWRHRH